MFELLKKYAPLWAPEDGTGGGDDAAAGGDDTPSSVIGGEAAGGDGEAGGDKGDDDASPPEDSTAPGEGEGDESPPPLTAEDLSIPEGLTVTDEQSTEFLSILNNRELSPAEQANALVAFQQTLQEQQVRTWIASQKERGQAILDDPEIGGKNWDDSQAAIFHVIDEFCDAPDEFKKELTDTGMGNSLHLARMLTKIGKLVAEGKPVVGGPTSAKDVPLADRMFPNQGKG